MIKCEKEKLEWLVAMQDHPDYLGGFALKLQSDHLQLRYELTLMQNLNPVRLQCSHEYLEKILAEKCKNLKHKTDHTVADLKNALYKAGKVDPYTRVIMCNMDKVKVRIYDVGQENQQRQQQIKKILTDSRGNQ